MLDLTVVILTKDEELHIRRCVENVIPIAKRILVVDSHSEDRTQEIAQELGAEVIQHKWPGNQAEQFNWAIDNTKIDTEWILRIDADEYLMPELIAELKTVLPALDKGITGVVFKRRHIFMGRWMRGGIYPVKILRLFRNGHARYEQRIMDEHLVLSDGKEYECENDFCDHNLNNLSWYCKKHIDYAIREAAELLDLKYRFSSKHDGILSGQAAEKRAKKIKYARKPLFWRSVAYFVYRYLLKGAWRDGKEGFIFSFIQGLWYRTLVDAKILEIEKKGNEDAQQIKKILSEEYDISYRINERYSINANM